MAQPSSTITSRKRRAESESPEPSNALLPAASSSATLIEDMAPPASPNTQSSSQMSRKKARLGDSTSSSSLPYDPTVKLEEESVSFPELDEAALSATASTRASTAADLVDDKVNISAPPVEGANQTTETATATKKRRTACEDPVASPGQDKGPASNVEASGTPDLPASSGNGASAEAGTSSSRKRPRLSQEESNDGSVAAQPPHTQAQQPTPAHSRSLRDIPWELISEILLYTKSMQDVLNLAMSCKFYCKTLLQPSNNFIWKYVRENHTPTLPPSYKNRGFGFDEVSYAAFLFAGGKCEVCGEHTNKPFTSFALRLRLCDKQQCEAKLVQSKVVKTVETVCKENNIPRQSAQFAVLEDQNILKSYKLIPGTGPERGRFGALGEVATVTRAKVPDNLRSFLIEERGQSDFREGLEKMKKKQGEWMSFCKDIIRWRRSVKDVFYAKKKENDMIGRAIANDFGWKYEDMVNCTDFGPYQRNKNHTYQTITKGDVAAMKPKIEEQLTALAEKRDRRAQEALYQAIRQQVLQHHKHLQNAKTFPVLPALTAFRQLPVITMLQCSEGEDKMEAKDVAKSLKTDKVLISLLKSQVNAWVTKAKTEFGEKMGVKRWKSISKNELHPAERMTARFKCKRCQVLDQGYEEDECFDFVGACAHDCSKPGKKNKGNWKWEAEQFEKDEEASSAIAKYMELCKLPDKAVSTAETVAVLQAASYVLCKSCPTPIVMKFNNLIGHSHRHHKMEFDLLKDPQAVEAAIGKKYPFKAGYTKLLLGTGKKVQEARGAKVYGCRHCYSKELADHRQTSAAKKAATANQASLAEEDPPVEEDTEPEARMFIFDGLKSHLIEKHEIKSVRDEDYFRTKVPVYLEKANA